MLGSLGFRHSLVLAPHHRQEPGVEHVSLRFVGIQLQGSFELPFRLSPLPLIPVGFYSQRKVSVGVGVVDRQRLLCGSLCLGPGLVGRQEPIVLAYVVVRQTAISTPVVRVDGDGSIEIFDAFTKALFGEFIGVVGAFKIKLIGLGIIG